jgi:integral membrane protein
MTQELLNSKMGRFRITAFLEGCSFLLLGFTMILKYKYQQPLPNKIVGYAHGFLFILYVGLLVEVARTYKWSLFKTFLGFIAALIPFGTFYADKKLFRA